MEPLYTITLILFIIGMIASIVIIRIAYISEQKLKKVSEKISDGYVIFRKSGKITNYNSAFFDVFSLKKDNIKGKDIKNIIANCITEGDEIPRIIKALDNIEEKKNFKIDVKRNNKILKLEIMSLIENDIFMRYVLIVKDVTQSYNMVENLKLNQESLANRERFITLRWINNWNCSFFKITYIFNNRRACRV